MAPRRATAFEVSFPEEATSQASLPFHVGSGSGWSEQPHPRTQNLNPSSGKRKNGIYEDSRSGKRQHLPQPTVSYYTPRADEVFEDKDLVITGEDRDMGYDSDDDDDETGEEDKPIRVLSDFSIFDPKHRMEMVSLSAIEEDDGVDRQFEGAGLVTALFLNDEDEGQEDDIESEPQYIRLGAILRYTIDYGQEDEPFYIETQNAWYILKMPSRLYRPYFRNFCTPHRVTQLVISSAISKPQQSYDAFLAYFLGAVNFMGQSFEEQDLWNAVSDVQEALEERDDTETLRTLPLLRHILRKAAPPVNRGRAVSRRRGPSRRLRDVATVGNPDLAVLKAENQNPTHVTPMIANLAQGLVREQLVVVGPRPALPNKAQLEAQKKQAHAQLCNFVLKAKRPNKDVNFRIIDRIARGSRYLSTVEVDGDIYRIGDAVIVPIGQDGNSNPPHLPHDVHDIMSSATLADYFWFARIIYINSEEEIAHIQWFEHGSQIFMEELAHPQELFLNDLCGHIPLRTITGKVTVHYNPDYIVKPDEFFFKFNHDKVFSSFTSVDTQRIKMAESDRPPDNCPVCLLHEQRDQESYGRRLLDGVAYDGQNYHLDDFVLFRARSGPASIGHITDILFPARATSQASITVTVKCVGRVSDLADTLPPSVIRDERHVFLTDDDATVNLDDLIRVCYVFPFQSIPDLGAWLSLSPDHFYIRYRFPSMDVKSWSDKRPVPFEDLHVCSHCCQEKLNHRKLTADFLTYAKRNLLPTLDLFGGVGAFSLGMAEGSGCIKVTHAIEISPSAAKTYKRNSPDTLVYNQCANTILRYAIKAHEGHQVEVPTQLFDSNVRVPPPPKPGDIKFITVGFPCQSHSALNMYRKANDLKSNLILNALSWVDYLRADFCYFENVPGFLRFNLNAVQAGLYRVEGGIVMGGMKILLRSLQDMGYQLRYGLLQAGHYGTPQGRVRFFLIAARHGLPLPDLPQPTHDFPLINALEIKLPNEDKIRPIRTANGTSPHPFVTIGDAISDLPRFDWKNPKQQRESAAKQRENRERGRFIPALLCKPNMTHCGYEGVVEYHHEPKTTYQVRARLKPTENLQHYTKCLLPKKVERVVTIPLNPNSDYRSLRPDLHEWQFANSSSAVAKANFRPGLYGRLDEDGWFPTTVTNMDPTAKQSKVLNPYCKRMVTVRELARSQGFPDNFVFESVNNNVVTMHRQIGNAVPWPVADALGRELRAALFKKWLVHQEDAIRIDTD